MIPETLMMIYLLLYEFFEFFECIWSVVLRCQKLNKNILIRDLCGKSFITIVGISDTEDANFKLVILFNLTLFEKKI